MPSEPQRELTVETSESYLYDPERVRALYNQLRPDPDLYGDDPAYAVFAYLDQSQFGADVFESQGRGGMWPTKDEPHDLEA
jgi:hypothetical protein